MLWSRRAIASLKCSCRGMRPSRPRLIYSRRGRAAGLTCGLGTSPPPSQYCASGFMQAEFDDGVATLRTTPLHACHAEPAVAPSGAAPVSAAAQGQSPTPHAAARPTARQFSLLDATPVSGLRSAVQAASQWLPQAQQASDRVAAAMAALREAEAAAEAATVPPTGSSAVLPRLHALLARAEHGAEAATQLGGSLRAELQVRRHELTGVPRMLQWR